jgi:hypothetical protein
MQNRRCGMKIILNETTLNMLKELIPDTKNVFAKLKAATDLMSNMKIEVNDNLKDGEMKIVKEDNE